MLTFKVVLNIIPCALLAVASICLVFVGIGCTGTSSPQSDLYFLQVNTSGLYSELGKVFADLGQRGLADSASSALDTASDDAENASGSTDVFNEASSIVSSANNAIQTAQSSVNSAISDIGDIKNQIPGFYRIGLWSYCEGSSSSNNVKNCTSPSIGSWFNITNALGVDGALIDKILPTKVRSLENIYHQASRFMSAAYILAMIFTPISLLLVLLPNTLIQLGILKGLVISIAICSNLAASVTATAVYYCLGKALASTSFLESSLGKSVFGNTWAAFALSMGAGIAQLVLKMCIHF